MSNLNTLELICKVFLSLSNFPFSRKSILITCFSSKDLPPCPRKGCTDLVGSNYLSLVLTGGEGEGENAVLSAKRWDRRSSQAPIDVRSVMPLKMKCIA